MEGFVYILRHNNNHFYIGSTTDINRRVAQHKGGHTRTTKRLGNFTLVFQQKYSSLQMARIVERKLKSMKRKDYIEKIIREGYIR